MTDHSPHHGQFFALVLLLLCAAAVGAWMAGAWRRFRASGYFDSDVDRLAHEARCRDVPKEEGT